MIPQNEILESTRRRVIVVDDELEFLKLIVHYLTFAGYDVTAVSTVFDFYQRIEDSFELAILDVGLPDQSGLELAAYLRKNTDMRIIMLTGFSTINDRLAGYDSGADLYLSKPVDFRELVAAIKTLLNRSDELVAQPPLHVARKKQLAEDSDSLFWKLVGMHWQLVTPQQECIKLTSKEFDFLTLLVACQKQVVPRTTLLKNLGYINNESGNSSLESLVKRLRQKIEAVSSQSPIHTSHGNGYSFSAGIVVV